MTRLSCNTMHVLYIMWYLGVDRCLRNHPHWLSLMASMAFILQLPHGSDTQLPLSQKKGEFS